MAGLGGGFALGGFADAFQRGTEQQSLDQYRIQELKLQQQAQENAQQRFQMSRIDAVRTEAMKGIDEAVSQLRIAGKEPAEITKTLMPWVERLATLAKTSGLDPASAVYAPFTAAVARPPATQTEAAMVRADPLKQAQISKIGAETEALKEGTEFSRQLLGETGVPPPSGGQPQPQPQPSISQPQPQPSVSNLDPKTGQPLSVPGGGVALDPNDKGDQFLATKPEGVRQVIKDIAEYRRSPNNLSARAVKGANISYRDLIMNMVEQYSALKNDPYDQTNFTARNRTASAFAGGVEARTTRSFNVLVSHLDVLREAADALKNGNITAFNRLKNVIRSELGQPEPDSFDAVKTIVADELAKAVIGSGSGALGDRQEIASKVSNAKSPATLATVMNDYQNLAVGQLEGLKKQYVSSGFKPDDFDKKFLLPRTQQFFKNVAIRTPSGQSSSGAAVPSGGVSNMSDDELKRKLGIK